MGFSDKRSALNWFVQIIVGTVIILSIVPSSMNAQMAAGNITDSIALSAQKRVKSSLDSNGFIIVNEIQQWKASETAMIICDMWDQHWCKGATERVTEMASRLNEAIARARSQGILIVHAPSDCMDYYKDHPARKAMLKYNGKKFKSKVDNANLPSEEKAIWPIDQNDGGCDDTVQCKPGSPWKKQIDALKIEDNDAISDSGAEIDALFEKRKIRNVIMAGVHTNMCVIARSFGLRSMVRLGKRVVLMRDMTDAMYNSKAAPKVNHFTGVGLMVEYIEKYVCPTILSTDFLGGKQFRFSGDTRPLIAFVTAEGEYRANQRLPEFAHHLMLTQDINCEFAIGKPAMDGPGRHNIENLQILEDADLAVFFVRRVALEPQKMDIIKKYVENGKPVLAIRTASHSFDAKGNVPREGGGVGRSKEAVDGVLAQWPDFDKDIIGGNYQGHYSQIKEPLKVEIVPGMEGHPLLKNIPAGGFNSPAWLYKNKPLRSPNDQVLLIGSIPGEAPEPVMWSNKTRFNNTVIYTSLGHWDDWKIEAFHSLMTNAVRYLLKKG